MADKVVIEGSEPVTYNREDGGYSLIAYVTDDNPDEPFYVKLVSHEEFDPRTKPQHTTARLFAGKKVRVTVEVVEE